MHDHIFPVMLRSSVKINIRWVWLALETRLSECLTSNEHANDVLHNQRAYTNGYSICIRSLCVLENGGRYQNVTAVKNWTEPDFLKKVPYLSWVGFHLFDGSYQVVLCLNTGRIQIKVLTLQCRFTFFYFWFGGAQIQNWKQPLALKNYFLHPNQDLVMLIMHHGKH